jgi:hypothetical protein
MGDKIIPLGLQRKRDEICGVIAHYERLIREAQQDLAHVNAALRLFEATGEAADLPPYVDLNRVLKRGETTKICMDALAAEGPLDTRQLALRGYQGQGPFRMRQGAGADCGAPRRSNASNASASEQGGVCHENEGRLRLEASERALETNRGCYTDLSDSRATDAIAAIHRIGSAANNFCWFRFPVYVLHRSGYRMANTSPSKPSDNLEVPDCRRGLHVRGRLRSIGDMDSPAGVVSCGANVPLPVA